MPLEQLLAMYGGVGAVVSGANGPIPTTAMEHDDDIEEIEPPAKTAIQQPPTVAAKVSVLL